jgi:pilus assembly protein CpaF
VFVAKRGRSGLTTTILAPGELADLVERVLRGWCRQGLGACS